jgi:hypothetical protein
LAWTCVSGITNALAQYNHLSQIYTLYTMHEE